ncbi:MAG: type II toxin-antitoxin system tRNA(fMet)-specific endonuclease VapC [Panacagrimonas sp.]
MTAPRYLLDTNICIYIRRQRPPSVLERFRKLRPGEAVISTITYGELLYGAAKNQAPKAAKRRLAALTELLPVLPLGEEVARIYGEIRASLESTGQVIGGNDLWIAAHAKASKLTLVTNNEREFRRVTGLKIENWA